MVVARLVTGRSVCNYNKALQRTDTHVCVPPVHGGGGSREALRIDEVKAKKAHIKLTLIVIIEFISYYGTW